MKLSAVELNAVTRALQQERERRPLRSLHAFVRWAWQIIEPGTPYVDNWHIAAKCEHLEAVSRGEIRFLLINEPPRCMKSTVTSVCWNAWEWGPMERPWERFLTASYSGQLAVRDALKTRRLVQHPEFRRLFGHVELSGDQNQKTRFENTRTGYRLATSVGGTATGEGGTRLVVDDPHSAAEAQSDTERQNALDWWDNTMSTRMNDPKRDVVVVNMQRLHEADLTGHLLKKEPGQWEHLMLPMELEVSRRCAIRVTGWRDPRTTEAELLWPERFDAASVARLKISLGEYGAAGQLQQRPSPAGGGILKVAHFQAWPHDVPYPPFEHVVLSYDTAFTASEENDPTAHTAWGTFRHRGRRCVMLLDAWSDFLGYPELRRRVLDNWRERYGKDDPARGVKSRRPDVNLVEEKGSGISLLQDLRQANVPCCGYNPGRDAKRVRAHAAAPILELGAIYIPETSRRGEEGKFVTWARAFVDQCERFPNDEHDDLVDTFTQVAQYLRDLGWFDLETAPDDEVEERDYAAEKKRRRNPYDA